jgi:hypothetical protein
MANGNQRLGAVIAALEKVSEHVSGMDDAAEVDTATYNRWVGMLDGVVEGNWKSLSLPDNVITASEMLMHVDAAIAFLQEHRE